MRVVITRDGILQPLVDYFLAPRNRRKARSWQRSVARAVGFLYDFVVQRGSAYQEGSAPGQLLSDFAHALLCGTMNLEGSDDSDLYWPGLSFTSADIYVGELTDFSDFCVKQYGAKALNPWTTAHWGERIAAMRGWDAHNKNSLFRHLGNRKAAWEESAHGRAVDLGFGPKADPERPPYFPPDRFHELLIEGRG